MARVRVFLDEATHRAIEAEARTTGVSRSRVIERAVAEYIESQRRAREDEAARRRFTEAVALADAVADKLGDWDPAAIIREFRDTPRVSQRRPPR
jgi:metal-responsive CopG/Arc/MetJ family transcriptional regulator